MPSPARCLRRQERIKCPGSISFFSRLSSLQNETQFVRSIDWKRKVVTVIPPSRREVLTTFSRQVSEAGSAKATEEMRGIRAHTSFMVVLLFRREALGQPKKQLVSLKVLGRVGQV